MNMMSRDTCRVTLGPLLLAIAVVALIRAPGAAALERDERVCELEDLTRILSLRVDPEAGYVCDVLYLKPDEGAVREVLWSARNNADYCRPRFDDMVEQLVSRGWACESTDEYTEAGDGSGTDAADERSDDDETSSKGVEGAFRDACVLDVASSANVKGSQSVKSYCDCITEGMSSEGLVEGDADVIFGGLASADVDDKRLNTLAASHESVRESCL